MQLFKKMHHFFCIGLSTRVIHPGYPPVLSTRVILLGYPPRLSFLVICLGYPSGLSVWVIRPSYPSGLSIQVIRSGYPFRLSAWVICPVIHPVIWCFPIWLTSSLSYPMEIYGDLQCEWNSDIFSLVLRNILRNKKSFFFSYSKNCLVQH